MTDKHIDNQQDGDALPRICPACGVPFPNKEVYDKHVEADH